MTGEVNITTSSFAVRVSGVVIGGKGEAFLFIHAEEAVANFDSDQISNVGKFLKVLGQCISPS
jgi:hypothetical protein